MSWDTRRVAVFVVSAVLSSGGLLHAADISSVKALYASASYEEALIQLKTLGPESNADEIQQYQALCLIALGRTDEAEEAVVRLIAGNPLFSVAERDLSPRFVALFESVRARTLPTVARGLYTQAKRSYDRGEYSDALERFSTLLTVVKGEEDASDELQALQQLAEGFQKLSEASLAKAAAPPEPPPMPQPAPPPPPAPAPVESAVATVSLAPPVFSRDDTTVRPPLLVSRPTPLAPSSLRARNLSGLLVLVVDEYGEVESASLSRPISPLYDDDLVEAAQRWRFRPARKDGVPVKYRVLFPITVN